MTLLIIAVLLLVLLPSSALALAMALGGPRPPAPMASVNAPFGQVDYADLPRLQTFVARDGAALGYRAYGPPASAARGHVVLVHGSASRSNSMHVLSTALAAAGYQVYALDMRGHGASGTRGNIRYIGQLEDDVEDFVSTVRPQGSGTLLGFSAGGGFALRVAGSTRQSLFDRYVLLSPLIHHHAPSYRPAGGGWASIGLPRMIALTILNRLGVRWFNALPVTAFAMAAEERNLLTPTYSFALSANFRPPKDYRATIQAVRRPLQVLAGEHDEVFYPERFYRTFVDAGREVPVRIVPGVDHVGIILAPAAVHQVVRALVDGVPH